VKDGRLRSAILPPEGSDGIWALRGDEVRARWWESGGEQTLAPAGRRGGPLARPVLLDPARGTTLWFFAGRDIPGEFDLEIDALRHGREEDRAGVQDGSPELGAVEPGERLP
jgi:hypothetical protein